MRLRHQAPGLSDGEAPGEGRTPELTQQASVGCSHTVLASSASGPKSQMDPVWLTHHTSPSSYHLRLDFPLTYALSRNTVCPLRYTRSRAPVTLLQGLPRQQRTSQRADVWMSTVLLPRRNTD